MCTVRLAVCTAAADISCSGGGKLAKTELLATVTSVLEGLGKAGLCSVEIRPADQADIDVRMVEWLRFRPTLHNALHQVFLMDFDTDEEDFMSEVSSGHVSTWAFVPTLQQEEFFIFAKGLFATLAVATRLRVPSVSVNK